MTPSSSSRQQRDRALRGDAERDPLRLDRGWLGAEHAAVAIEGREVLRQLQRVGGDPVRRAPRGRLGDLPREGEQALDQRTLGRVQRLFAAARAPRAPAATRSDPAFASIEAIRACAYWT